MQLFLEPIRKDLDRTKKIYSSPDCQDLLKMWDDFYPRVGYHFPWIGYFIVMGNQIVGSCAFTGKPVNNKVEISYWTFKDFEGRGIASFACQRLISIALEADPGLIITAKTAPEKNSSARVLEKNGFIFAGIVQDHEIGDAWEWTLAGFNQIN